MKRNIKQTSTVNAIDYDKLSKLIYYKVNFEMSNIDDLTTALSYETIVEICAKHLGLDENELLSKRDDKYRYHRYVFIGTLFLYLNVDPKAIGKRIGRFRQTVFSSAKVLSYCLETWLREYDKELRPVVEKILLECEQESGGRIFKNVHPETTFLSECINGDIQVKEHKPRPYFSVEEILETPIRSFNWFSNFSNIEVFSIDGKNQYSIHSPSKTTDSILYLMQSFGYRFVNRDEYISRLNQQTAKIQEQTLEKLRSFLNGNSNRNKCDGCVFKLNNMCPAAVQESGFCPKDSKNTPNVKYENGETTDFVFSNRDRFKETPLHSYVKN